MTVDVLTDFIEFLLKKGDINLARAEQLHGLAHEFLMETSKPVHPTNPEPQKGPVTLIQCGPPQGQRCAPTKHVWPTDKNGEIDTETAACKVCGLPFSSFIFTDMP